MSRRRVSPVKPRTFTDTSPHPDEREQIIGRLKEELVLARGKEKQVAILEKYLFDLEGKSKILGDENKKKEMEGKSKTEAANRVILQLKRDVEDLKAQLKNCHIELGERQAEHLQLKKHLAKRSTEIDKLRKESVFLKEENEQLLIEQSKLQVQVQNLEEDIRRINANRKNYEARINQINNKIIEVKAYIGDLNSENKILKEKLRNYESENNNINENLQEKQTKIDLLQDKFSQKHDQIKAQIDDFIELQHLNEKCVTETKHKIHLLKSQNEKSNELNSYIKKTEKKIAEIQEKKRDVETESKQIDQVNDDYSKQIEQMKKDYERCQIHLQNLMKNNSLIRQELEKCLREDEQVISTLQKKRIYPIETFGRQSRKNTARTARTFDQY